MVGTALLLLLQNTTKIVGCHGFLVPAVGSLPISSSSSSWIRRPTSHDSQLPLLLLLHNHHNRNNNHSNKRSTTTSTTTTTALSMALIPLSVEDMDGLLVVGGPPTGAQAATYWGRTQQERYGRIFETSVVTILGVCFSYFLSFVLGGFVATLLGSIFLFWSIFSPQLQAYQRNWELRGGRDLVDPWSVGSGGYDNNNNINVYDDDDGDGDFVNDNDNIRGSSFMDKQGLYGALFLGYIEDVCVVEEPSSPAADEFDLEDFADYNMEADELEKWSGMPYLLRVKARDKDKGRTLQVHARMSEEYVELEPGLPILGVILSTSQQFTTLAALTDLFVPDLECWIGDYPYLDRAETEQLLANDDEIWDLLQSQRRTVPLNADNNNNDVVSTTMDS